MNTTHESYLVPFFEEMNAVFPNEWCVLHSYDTLPFYSESDVDMAFSGNDISELESVITKVAHNHGWRIYQKLWYDVQYCYYYVLKHTEGDIFLAIDFLIDNQGIGKYGFKTSTLTEDCVMIKELFPIPNSEAAFCYKLIKRIQKKRSLKEDKSYLLEQYKVSDPSKISFFLTEQLGKQGNEIILKYLEEDGYLPSNDEIQFLKSQRGKRNQYLKYRFWETKRTINRLWYPSGMIINIPELSNKELNLFCDLLEKKVNILFRFTKLNSTNSSKIGVTGLVGSTLVVCPKKNFDHNKALRFDWRPSKFMPLQELNQSKVLNIENMATQYYRTILKALRLRMSNKQLINEE